MTLPPFREIWCVDFEFAAVPGERPDPACLVARELRSGRTVRLWVDEFGDRPPYSIGPDSLFVAYYASAELGCHAVLGWPMPARILDLCTEFRAQWNGFKPPGGNFKLLSALVTHGLDGIAAAEKQEMQQKFANWRKHEWTYVAKREGLDYCESDVAALAQLLPAMLPAIDLPRALLRGRYMAAAAWMEFHGVPIDTRMLNRLRSRWAGIKDQLIIEVDKKYGVFENGQFRQKLFERYLIRTGIPWLRLESGRLDLEDDTFHQAAKAYPQIAPLHNLRVSLSRMKLFKDLAVGSDGRNRALLSAFGSESSRNQPSNAKFIFGPATWLRGLIKPPKGRAVAYLDWKQQEFGIAAALSRDEAMQEAYRSGDPYLAFAKMAGAVPEDATKESHKDTRELFKTCVLGTQYGMEWHTLAQRIGGPPLVARDLLRSHHETFRRFWAWSERIVDHAMLFGSAHTVFGWTVRVGNPDKEKLKPGGAARSLRNFPMQANGAEMLRLACCLATEARIEVCAPVHDALLICAPNDRIEADVAATKDLMREASRIVLDGFEIGVDENIVRHPGRYMDPRGATMWNQTMRLIGENAAVVEE
jgi:DNA polymerase I